MYPIRNEYLQLTREKRKTKVLETTELYNKIQIWASNPMRIPAKASDN